MPDDLKRPDASHVALPSSVGIHVISVNRRRRLDFPTNGSPISESFSSRALLPRAVMMGLSVLVVISWSSTRNQTDSNPRGKKPPVAKWASLPTSSGKIQTVSSVSSVILYYIRTHRMGCPLLSSPNVSFENTFHYNFWHLLGFIRCYPILFILIPPPPDWAIACLFASPSLFPGFIGPKITSS